MTEALKLNMFDYEPAEQMGSVTHVNFITHEIIEQVPRRSTSLLKSNGIPKASTADPIRSIDDVHAMQQYFLDAGNLRDYTMFTIGIIFGLRAGDLLSLRISNVLEPDGHFKSHCDLIESKTRKFNNPAITQQAREVLAAYLTECRMGCSYNDPLFVSRKHDADGSPRTITITQINRILKAAAKACNVSGHISSHSLRKTFAYHMIKSNPNSDAAKFAVQQMLNHNDFKTTLAYCGITQEEMDDFREDLGAYFMVKES